MDTSGIASDKRVPLLPIVRSANAATTSNSANSSNSSNASSAGILLTSHRHSHSRKRFYPPFGRRHSRPSSADGSVSSTTAVAAATTDAGTASAIASVLALCLGRRSRRLLWTLFTLALFACVVCLATLGVLVQQNALSNGAVDHQSSSPTMRASLLASWRQSQVVARLQHLSSWLASSVSNAPVRQSKTRDELRALSEYSCLGWRQTGECSPQGPPEEANNQNCSTLIADGVSGYCELQHTHTGERRRVLQMHCDSLRPGVLFSCDMFQSLLSYNILSTDYVHDANASDATNRDHLRATNHLLDTPVPLDEDGVERPNVGQMTLSFERGIIMVVYDKLLLSAYVSVRSLRAMGSTLPIEMWYMASETDVDHPLLRILVADYGVYLREITDTRATRFYTKLHAIFYSAFDNILLLDADNFPVRDPSYLFDTPEFVDSGALFWPDFWKPDNTIFNIHERSFVWGVFGLEYVNMFEQESGQLLINRPMHRAALNVVMFYGFTEPRVHEELRLVWGDKDLFRFAWMKTESSFYMIPRPPGAAGTKHPDYDLFCGVTMVQHDPRGKIVFLHRNTEKLVPTNDRLLWTHIQQFKRASKLKDFYVRGANGGKVFPQFKRCFGKDVHYDRLFTLKPMNSFAFENLELDLLSYAKEGAAILNASVLASGNSKSGRVDTPVNPDE